MFLRAEQFDHRGAAEVVAEQVSQRSIGCGDFSDHFDGGGPVRAPPAVLAWDQQRQQAARAQVFALDCCRTPGAITLDGGGSPLLGEPTGDCDGIVVGIAGSNVLLFNGQSHADLPIGDG